MRHAREKFGLGARGRQRRLARRDQFFLQHFAFGDVVRARDHTLLAVQLDYPGRDQAFDDLAVRGPDA